MSVGIIQPLPASTPADKAREEPFSIVRSWRWPGWRQALVYMGLYSLTFVPGSSQPYLSPFWFPDSVRLSALLLSPRACWWFYILAPLPLRMFLRPPGVPLWLLLTSFFNDSIKSLLSAFLIQRFLGRRLRFTGLRQLLAYSLIAVLGIPLLSALGGAAVRLALGKPFLSTFVAWFMGDVLAALICTPMLLSAAETDWRRISDLPGKRIFETVSLIAGFFISAYLALGRNTLETPFLLYLPMPFLLWAATRFGLFGAASSLSGISLVAILGILRGVGPFAKIPPSSALQSLQLFLIVISVPLLALAVVVRQERASAAALRESEIRLHQLSARLMDSLESERKILCRQLNEDMAQRVAALGLGLSSLSQTSGISENLAAEASRLRQHASDVAHDLSRLSNQLTPVMLETVGLSLALETLCSQANNHPDIAVDYEQSGQPDDLAWETSVSLYRVAQEALDNALAHSGASRISVRLFCQKQSWQLFISDNGSGFDLTSAAVRGFGIAAMSARMRSMGGSLRIDTTLGRGTEVIASIPLPSPCLTFAAV